MKTLTICSKVRCHRRRHHRLPGQSHAHGEKVLRSVRAKGLVHGVRQGG
jgi:hypothetical protein